MDSGMNTINLTIQLPFFLSFCGKPDATPIDSDSNQMLVWLYNEQPNALWTQIDFTLI